MSFATQHKNYHIFIATLNREALVGCLQDFFVVAHDIHVMQCGGGNQTVRFRISLDTEEHKDPEDLITLLPGWSIYNDKQVERYPKNRTMRKLRCSNNQKTVSSYEFYAIVK